MSDREVLDFDDLASYLLLKNGNYLYKIPYRDGWAVLKVFICSRNWFRRLYKTFDNIVICGQTSFMRRARLRNELACMRLWRDAGFKVFDVYENVAVKGVPEGYYVLYEYVPGRHFHRFLPDESVPMEERLHWFRVFLEEWHRRHVLAISTRNSKFIHENGDFKHVMLHDNRLYWFDFEMTYRSGRQIEDLVAREILAYIRTLAAFLPVELYKVFFAEIMDRYPDREILERIHPFMFANRNLAVRFGRWIDFHFKRRSKKFGSKYMIAREVQEYLNAHPPSGK